MKARITIILTAMLCWLWCSTAFAKASPLSEEAQKHFDAGLAYADDPGGPKWDEAMKEFLAAYAISPTWKLKNNIGLCALHLERDGEAIEAYTEYLAHGGEQGLSDKHRKQIKKDIAMLSASLVRVTLEVEPAEATIIDERKTANGELRVNRYPAKDGKASLGLHPGAHKITVEAPGFVSDTWTFEADPSSTHQHSFKLSQEKKHEAAFVPDEPTVEKPEPAKALENERRNYTGAYIGLAATGVFAVATTVTGVLALKKSNEYGDTTDPAKYDSLRSSGKTLVLLTDIGLGASLLGAGLTTYLFLAAPKVEQPKQAKVRFNFSPVASPNSAGVAMHGKF